MSKIDYVAVLADLQARRQLLDNAIEAIKMIVSEQPTAADPRSKPVISGPDIPRPGDLDYVEPLR